MPKVTLSDGSVRISTSILMTEENYEFVKKFAFNTTTILNDALDLKRKEYEREGTKPKRKKRKSPTKSKSKAPSSKPKTTTNSKPKDTPITPENKVETWKEVALL